MTPSEVLGGRREQILQKRKEVSDSDFSAQTIVQSTFQRAHRISPESPIALCPIFAECSQSKPQGTHLRQRRLPIHKLNDSRAQIRSRCCRTQGSPADPKRDSRPRLSPGNIPYPPNAASILFRARAISLACSSVIFMLKSNLKLRPRISSVCGSMSFEYSTFP